MKKRKAVEQTEIHPISETKNYIKKSLTMRLSSIYPIKEIIIFSLIYFVVSLIVTLSIIFSHVDNAGLMKNVVQFITPFYAITIGFSVTTIIFILNNIERFDSINKQNLFDIISLIITYIIIGIITIMMFLFIIIFGTLFNFNNTLNDFFSFIIFLIVMIVIFISFHLFFTIIQIIYLLSYNLIEGKSFKIDKKKNK